MGFGLGAFFFNFVVVALINPDNAQQTDHLFPREVGDNVPFTLRIMSIIYAAVGLVGCALIQPPLRSDEQLSLLAVAEVDELQGHSHCSGLAFQLASKGMRCETQGGCSC